MSEFKRVAIVDDDEAVRESTGALLESSGFTADLFQSGDEFLEIDPNSTDCILLDMRMPGADGIEVLRQLGERDTCPPVVVLTGHGDLALAVEAMKLGAMDFIEKPYEPSLLLNALHVAIANRRGDRAVVPPSKEALALVNKLSSRQCEVLRGMLGGEPNKIMAWKLGLSIRTVEAHRAQVMSRLQVRSIAEAVQLALAAGLGSDRAECAPS